MQQTPYVYQARFLTNRGLSPLSLTTAQLVAATMVLVLVPLSGRVGLGVTTQAIVAVVVLGVAGTGLALVINFTLIASEGPTTASVVTISSRPSPSCWALRSLANLRGAGSGGAGDRNRGGACAMGGAYQRGVSVRKLMTWFDRNRARVTQLFVGCTSLV